MSDIKITIGGDATELVRATKQAEAGLSNVGAAAQKSTGSIGLMSVGVGGLVKSFVSGGLITAIGGAVIALIELGKELLETNDDQKKFVEQQKRFSEALSGASSVYVKAVTDVNNLRIAFQQAKDGIITKNEALKLYNETIGKTTGEVKSLDAAEKELAKNADAYIRFTLLKAAANLAQGKAAEQALKAVVKQQELAAARADTNFVSDFTPFAEKTLKEQQEFEKEGDKFLNVQKYFLDEAKKIADQFGFDFNKIKEPVQKAEKDVLTITKVLEKLRLELSFLATKELTFKTDETKAKVNEIEKAIETLVTKLNVAPNDKLIKRLFGDINDLKLPGLFKEIADFARKERLTIPIFFDESQVGAALQEALTNVLSKFKGIKDGTSVFGGADLELKAPIKIDTNLAKESLMKELRGLGVQKIYSDLLKIKIPIELGSFDELNKALQEAYQKLQGFQNRVTDLIENTFTNVFAGVGEAIGNALAGGNNAIPNLFESLMSNVGTQIQELGKFLIKSAITIELAKKAFAKLLANPVAAVAVGVGLVALGALLKQQASKKFGGFASGGTVGDAGFYNVGERGQERVFLPRGTKVQPNNEVQAYGGGNIVLQPSIEYSGTGFRIMLNRVDAQMSRNG